MAATRVLEKPLPKVDGVDKVTGKSHFGADTRLAGMLHGKILRSPHAHARIKSIDVGKALALPGVAAVITGADFPALAPGAVAQMGGQSLNMYDLSRVVMARDKALFVGHPVAAVAATSTEVAEEAISLIEVEYDVLPPVLDALKAMEPDAPLLHEDLHTRGIGDSRSEEPSNVALHLEMGRGYTEQGFAGR